MIDTDEGRVEAYGICDDRLLREKAGGIVNRKKHLKTTTGGNLLPNDISIKG